MKISARMIFSLVDRVGEGNHNGFSIYSLESDIYRVDCGSIGSFEVCKLSGEEEYNLKSDDWIFVDGVIYRYTSCHLTFDGYPLLTIEQAYNKINS